MSFSDDEKLLSEYLEWKATNRQNDLTPASFLVARAEHAAFEKLEAVVTWFEQEWEKDMTDDTYKVLLSLKDVLSV